MPFPYKNPLNAQLLSAPYSVPRNSVQGTDYSVLGIGGWMEVANLSDLSLTFSGVGLQTLSANTVPINIYILLHFKTLIYILVMELHLTHHTLT